MADKKTQEEEFDERVAKAVAKALSTKQDFDLDKMSQAMAKAMVTAQAAIQQANNQDDHSKRMAELKKRQSLEERCSICYQVVGDGRGRGCGGPYARDPKTMQFITESVLHPDGSEVIGDDGKPMQRRIERPSQFHTKMVVCPDDAQAAEWFFGIKTNGATYQSQNLHHEIWVPSNAVGDILHRLRTYEQNEREQRTGRSHVRKNGGSISGTGRVDAAPAGVGFQ